MDWVQGLKPFLDEKGIDTSNLKKYKGSTYYPTLQEIFFMEDESECVKLMKEFNSSHHIRELPIFQDGSDIYFKNLHNKGYDIHAVTCIGDDKKTKMNRTDNLINIFGEVFNFDKVIALPVRTSKEPYLKSLQEQGDILIYIDDRINHLSEAKNLGIKTVLYSNDGKKPDHTVDSMIDCLSKVQQQLPKNKRNKKNRP